MSPINISASAYKRHQPTPKEWMELKPKIWDLYIKQNKNLRHVIEVLCGENGFVLTKKQLTRKLAEWRFRKNTRAAERNALLDDGRPVSDESPYATVGISVTDTKVERWKRTKAKEEIGAHSGRYPSDVSGSSNAKNVLGVVSAHSQPTDLPYYAEDCQSAEVVLQTPEIDEVPRLDSSGIIRSTRDLLSKVFENLSIEPSKDINYYALSVHTLETDDPVDSEYISSDQFDDLTGGNDTSHALILPQPDSNALSITERNCSSISPFKEVCFWSPFEPSNLVSRPPQKAQRVKQIIVNQYHIREYEKRLSKLQKLLPETHPAIRATLRGLRDVNDSMGNRSRAEHWSKELIAINRKTEGPESMEHLLDLLESIGLTAAQGRGKEAKELYEQLEPAVKRNYSMAPSVIAGMLTQASLRTKIRISNFLGTCDNSSCELLQLTLNVSGPYGSFDAMYCVAKELEFQGFHAESTQISLLGLQLLERSNRNNPLIRCNLMRTLARSLCSQGQYQDSVKTARQAVTLAEEYFGVEDNLTLLIAEVLGECLASAGFLPGSKGVYEDILAKRVRFFGEDNIYTILTMSALGQVLVTSNHYDEAIVYCEKSFHHLLKITGFGLWQAHNCKHLQLIEKYYEYHGRYTDAISLSEQIVRGLQIPNETNPPPSLKRYYFYFVYKLMVYYLHEGRDTEAICISQGVLEEIEQKGWPEDQDWQRSLKAKLADCYQLQGQYVPASTLYEQCIANIHEAGEWTYIRCLCYTARLGLCYKRMQRYSDALALYERSIREITVFRGPYELAISQIQTWVNLLYDHTSEVEKELFDINHVLYKL